MACEAIVKLCDKNESYNKTRFTRKRNLWETVSLAKKWVLREGRFLTEKQNKRDFRALLESKLYKKDKPCMKNGACEKNEPNEQNEPYEQNEPCEKNEPR